MRLEFQQYRFVGIAHIHLPHHVQKQILAVGVVDQRPTKLLGILLECLLFEVFEGPVITHGHHQIRYQQAIPDIPLNGLRLHIYPTDELHLGDHPGSFFLPVKNIHQLVVQSVHRPVDEGIRALTLVIKPLFGGFLLFGAQHQCSCTVRKQATENKR